MTDHPRHHEPAAQEHAVCRALSTSSSMLLALIVLTAMSGPLAAPRALSLAALGQTACTIQSTFRALAAGDPAEPDQTRRQASARASRSDDAPAQAGAHKADRQTGHTRLHCSLPPPVTNG